MNDKSYIVYIYLTLGQSPRRLMAGFMITTMFLSMWIANTASTALMVPISDAIMSELYYDHLITEDEYIKVCRPKQILA